MTLNVLHELGKYGRSQPRKAPPIPVVLPNLGPVGYVSGAVERGLYLNSGMERHVRSILREHYRVERLARDLSGGVLGADEALAYMTPRTDRRDPMRAAREGVRAVRSAVCAMASFNDIITARTSGKYWDYLGAKASQTTVANNWSSFLRTAGNPGAASYTAIPGGTTMTSASAGAWPLPMTLGGSEHLYLTNVGTNHITGTNIVLVVDALVNAGTISCSSNTTQTLSTTSLSRWTTGEGVQMTLEVTTALGGTAANATLNYTDQDGSSGNSTGAIAMTTSAATGRLVPVQDGPQIRLASGDYGVRSIQTLLLSASMVGGNVAAILYKALMAVPTLSSNVFAERSTPAQIGGIKQLTSSVGGEKPFIGFFVMTSTTSTGLQTYFLETVYGTP